MPSNKNRDKIRQLQRQQQIETTGKNEVIYKTVALCPVVENNEVVYKIVEIEFTNTKKFVSMVEVDSTKLQSAAFNKLHLAVGSLYDITQLRKTVKKLKEDLK